MGKNAMETWETNMDSMNEIENRRRCNELPGHNGCKNKIRGHNCPAEKEMCVGRISLRGSNVMQAIKWLRGDFTEPQQRTTA
jgi:hypothetical protein